MGIGGKTDFPFHFVHFCDRMMPMRPLPQIPMSWKVTLMKRIFTLLMCAMVLLGMTACSSSEEPTPTDATVSATIPAKEMTEAPTDAPTVPPTAPAAPTDIQLVDNVDMAVRITGIENNEHAGMQLHIQCENKTDRTLMFSWDMVSVCGYMYDPFWAEEVAAGKTANSTIDLDTYELEQMGITSVDEITFTLNVIDSENWMDTLLKESFTIYPTGLSASTWQVPRREVPGALTVAENENFRFVIEGSDGENASQYTIFVYLENNTDRNLMYSWDMVSVNGFMADPFWATSVAAGKRACSEISFSRAELEANGITDVSEIEFTLLVSDYDDWEADYLLQETYTYQP